MHDTHVAHPFLLTTVLRRARAQATSRTGGHLRRSAMAAARRRHERRAARGSRAGPDLAINAVRADLAEYHTSGGAGGAIGDDDPMIGRIGVPVSDSRAARVRRLVQSARAAADATALRGPRGRARLVGGRALARVLVSAARSVASSRGVVVAVDERARRASSSERARARGVLHAREMAALAGASGGGAAAAAAVHKVFMFRVLNEEEGGGAPRSRKDSGGALEEQEAGDVPGLQVASSPESRGHVTSSRCGSVVDG